MYEYEDERDMECLCKAVGVCETPGEGGQCEEEGEEVREGRIGSVVGFCSLFLHEVSPR